MPGVGPGLVATASLSASISSISGSSYGGFGSVIYSTADTPGLVPIASESASSSSTEGAS